MPDPHSIATIRAAVETILPRAGDRAGAADLDVDRHVVELVEMALPGFVDLIAALLNAYAGGAPFSELAPDERTAVLRAMCTDESQDVRDAVDALLVFTYGGMHSEWTGYDRASGALRPPAVWAEMGYGGPVRGHPAYREDA
jgi:hypothetical protein